METPGSATSGRTAPAATAPAAVGDGRYVLGELLGSGGMGLVFRARDQELGREVAVKLLADNLAADEEARERFAREARAAARISHPNVVQVFDVGEEAGRPYFVMELVAGASLADVLQADGPLSSLEVESVAAQALAGLARAHASGLLHRDLKPANLLRTEAATVSPRTGVDGATVKVTDFGVAQAAELPGMTRTGLVLGTLPYVAPERLAGGPASVATDLYGLGATLLELLTGTAPAAGAPDDVSGWAVKQLDTVPPRLTALIRACLAPDPDARPASADDALAILDGAAPPGRPPARSPAADAATAVLPLEEHAPTVAVPADDPPTPGAVRGTGPLPQPLRARGWVRWVALAGLVVLVGLALAQLGGDVPPDAGGVPPGGTPAETARNLAEWLRARSG